MGAFWQVQAIFKLVPYQIKPHQAGDCVQPCNAHGVIVIEEARCLLLIWIKARS